MTNIAKYINTFAYNLRLVFYKSKKISIVLNYHRIGNIDPQNPFHRLHTVSLSTFKLQIKLCSFIGKFVSLNEIVDSNLKTRLNFSITFDDVSLSTYEALEWLNNQNIPFAICPCQSITENGIGWRDKVYFIEKYLENEVALKEIRKIFPLVKINSNDKFYNLSKSKMFDQREMIEGVVENLFEKAILADGMYQHTKNYFDASDLVKMKGEFKSVEIVNHSVSHANLSQFTIEKLSSEIEGCDEFLGNLLDIAPKYFAVPFGGFESQLAINLCEVSRLNNKKAILWVGNQFNLDIGAKQNKIKQIARFHTSASVVGLLTQIALSFCKQDFQKFIAQFNTNGAPESKVVPNPKIPKILAFEEISRPTKNYSGDSKFLTQTYITNPFLEDRAHTFAEIKNEHIVAIGQNLPLPFSGIDGFEVVNLFGNWRSVNGASKIGVAAILGKSIKDYRLTLSYKPSRFIKHSFIKMGWTAVTLQKFHSNLRNLDSHGYSQDLVVTHDVDEVKDFSQFNCKNADTIQLELSKKLIRWRVQNYPLANPVYFSFADCEGEKALVIGQYNATELLLLDQRFSSLSALRQIVEKILQWTSHKNLQTLTAETSCIQTQKVFAEILPNLNLSNETCYLGQKENLLKLHEKEVIITPLSSDILLR